MRLIQKINVVYCHLQIEGVVDIPITCTHVEQVFGIPPGRRKLVLDTHHHHDRHIPSIQEIEHLMVETKCQRILTSFCYFHLCYTFGPNYMLRGSHALWHAPPEALIGDVNWGQILLDELMHEVHYYRHSRGSYIRDVCCSFGFVFPKNNYVLYQLYLSFSFHNQIP